MRVGVLGGGLQGCCAALALADQGVHVTLFDRNQALVTRAGVANEGKIHLGYMYAGDPSLRTAKTVEQAGLNFYIRASGHDCNRTFGDAFHQLDLLRGDNNE